METPIPATGSTTEERKLSDLTAREFEDLLFHSFHRIINFAAIRFAEEQRTEYDFEFPHRQAKEQAAILEDLGVKPV